MTFSNTKYKSCANGALCNTDIMQCAKLNKLRLMSKAGQKFLYVELVLPTFTNLKKLYLFLSCFLVSPSEEIFQIIKNRCFA